MKRSTVLLLALMASALGAAPGLKINGGNAEVSISSDGLWHFSRNYTLRPETPENAELRLDNSGWRKHPKDPAVCGYNGDIVVKLQLPGPVSTLECNAEICNYADRRKRAFAVEYSFDGTNYLSLEKVKFAGGKGKASCSAAVEGGHDLIFIRLRRILEKGDHNGARGYVVFRQLSFRLNGKTNPQKTALRPKRLKEVFPTGVFWPWERTEFNGKRAGMELWQFVEYTMKTLADNGYNTIWVVHFADDPFRLFSLAKKYGIQVLLESRTVTFFYTRFRNISDIDAASASDVARLGHAEELLGYVLKDEPRFHDLGWVNYIYDRMRLADPERDCIFSVMNRQFPTYLRSSRAPVVMTDMYYFFAPKSIQGPNTPEYSKKLLSNALYNAGKLAERHGKHYWFCGQIFQDYWGRKYRKGNNLVALAGGYHHWRMPTPAEVRWQIWEALRNGAKGMFFYVLYGPRTLEVPPDQVRDPEQLQLIKRWDASQKEAAGWKKQPLTEKDMLLPPGEGLLDFDGTPTAQMLASSETMKLIRKHEKLLLALRKNDFPAFFCPDKKILSETFRLPGSEKLYGVVVNHDCDNRRTMKLLFPANTRHVRDLRNDRSLLLKEAGPSFRETELTLEAGGGALLEADFSVGKGIPLCNEEFDNETYFCVTIGKDAEVFSYGDAGFKMNHAVRLRVNGKSPVAVMRNLIHQSPFGAFTRNLNAKTGDGILYCMIDGDVDSAEIRAVSGGPGKDAQANFQHLKVGQSVAESGKDGKLIHSGYCGVPVAVPVGTSELEFHLADPKDHIDRIRLWFVPKPAK